MRRSPHNYTAGAVALLVIAGSVGWISWSDEESPAGSPDLYHAIYPASDATLANAHRYGFRTSGLFFQDQSWYDRQAEVITDQAGYVAAVREAAERSPAPWVIFNHEIARLVKSESPQGELTRTEAFAQLRLAEGLAKANVAERFGSWGAPRNWASGPNDGPEALELLDRYTRGLEVCSGGSYHSDIRTIAQTGNPFFFVAADAGRTGGATRPDVRVLKSYLQ